MASEHRAEMATKRGKPAVHDQGYLSLPFVYDQTIQSYNFITYHVSMEKIVFELSLETIEVYLLKLLKYNV